MPGAPRIVALLGVGGSGKTVVARRLLAANFHRVRFADAARDMLSAGFGSSPHEIDGDQRDIQQARFGGHSTSSIMRSLIHDWGRSGVHSDIWVHEWRRRVGRIGVEHGDAFVLTDDLRRPNEAAAVRDAGGVIVRITRPGYIPLTGASSLHRQAEIKADIELINEGPDKLALLADQFLAGLATTTVAA